MVRKLPAGAVIVDARKEREHHFVRRQADAEIQSEIAIVRNENIFAAHERHRRARLHRFVPFARRSERNLALAVERKAAIFQRAVQDHHAQHRDELLVG